MANWSSDPTWIPISQINGNKIFKPADGVTADDMNKIINNMIYLRKHGNRVTIDAASAYVVGKTLYLKSAEV